MSIRSNLAVLLAEQKRNGDLDAKVNLKEIAAATGLHWNTLYEFANHKTERISFETLDKLCRYLHCTPNDLLYYDPKDSDGNRQGHR